MPAMRLEDYALKGKEKQLVGLLHKLKDVFFRQSAPELLRACCAVLRHVSDDPSSATVRESAERVLREAADSLALKLKKLLPVRCSTQTAQRTCSNTRTHLNTRVRIERIFLRSPPHAGCRQGQGRPFRDRAAPPAAQIPPPLRRRHLGRRHDRSAAGGGGG